MASEAPRLIGLIGRKGAGKDTVAETLLRTGYQNVKFAGALKGMIGFVLAYQGVDESLIDRMIEGDLKEVPTEYLAGRTPRYAMQTLGTEWGRDLIGETFWVGTAMARVGDKKTVITDVRFPNEVAAVVTAGGVPIGVEADWIVPTEGEHESERLIDDLIRALPWAQRITNRRAAAPSLVGAAIENLRHRFARLIEAL